MGPCASPTRTGSGRNVDLVAVASLALTRDLTALAGFALTPDLAFAREITFPCIPVALAFVCIAHARLSLPFAGDLMLALGAAQPLTGDLTLTLGVTPVASGVVTVPVGGRRHIDVTGLRRAVAYLNQREGRRDACWHDKFEVSDWFHDLSHSARTAPNQT